MALNLPSDAPAPKLCILMKNEPSDEYGYNLHAEKGKQQFIGTVDESSPAHRAGLRPGDRIYAVNGQSIIGESHKQVVQKIKDFPLKCELLVISEAGAEWYKERNIPITLSLPNVIRICKEESLASEPEKEIDSESPTPAAQNWYAPKETEKISNVGLSSPSGNKMTATPRPRLCTLRKVKPEDEFGFNLHAEKGRGHFVGAVDKGGIGERAGLCIGQRIVGVNGKLIYAHTPHREVVALIKENPLVTELLVASEEVDRWYMTNHTEYSFQNAEIFFFGTPVGTVMEIAGKGSNDQERAQNNLARTLEMPASAVSSVTREPANSEAGDMPEPSPLPYEKQDSDTIRRQEELPVKPLKEHVAAKTGHSPLPRTTIPDDHHKQSPATVHTQYNSTNERNGDLDIFSLSAEEARNRLVHRKKDPRLDTNMSIEEKHRLISNM